jgi:hypothetical protein
MKPIRFYITAGLLFATLFSSAQTPKKIVFSYDDVGNRTIRKILQTLIKYT